MKNAVEAFNHWTNEQRDIIVGLGNSLEHAEITPVQALDELDRIAAESRARLTKLIGQALVADTSLSGRERYEHWESNRGRHRQRQRCALQGHLPERRAPPRVQSRLDNPFNRELCGRSPHGQGCGEDRSLPGEQCVRLGVPDVSRSLRRLRPVQLLDQFSGLRLILGWLLGLRLLLVLLSPVEIPGN